MYKKLTTQPRNAAQVHSVRVEAVGGMSTGVDQRVWFFLFRVKAVSEISTGVDIIVLRIESFVLHM